MKRRRMNILHTRVQRHGSYKTVLHVWQTDDPELHIVERRVYRKEPIISLPIIGTILTQASRIEQDFHPVHPSNTQMVIVELEQGAREMVM